MSGFFSDLNSNTLSELENDEVVAGTFVCNLLDGNVDTAIDIVGQEIVDELQDDWNTIVGFVEDLPDLAEGLVWVIVNGVDEGVSIIGDLFTNPGAAASAFESIGGDIVSAAVSFGDVIGCDFGISTDCVMTSSTIDFIAQISNSCSAILANPSYPPTYTSSYPASVMASTTYDSTSYATSYAASSYTYSPSPSYYSSAPVATAEGYSSSYETSHAYSSSPMYIFSLAPSSTNSGLPSAAVSSGSAAISEPNENQASINSWTRPVLGLAASAILTLAFGMLLL